MERREIIGHTNVIERRLDILYNAIRARDWGDTEYAFDQVLRAVQKLEAACDD